MKAVDKQKLYKECVWELGSMRDMVRMIWLQV
jgi:hypothetical protein